MHYIEGGWPGSNPKDVSFFKDIKKEKLFHAKIAAFGSTRRAKVTPDKDSNIITLVKAEPDAITILARPGISMCARRCGFRWKKISS